VSASKTIAVLLAAMLAATPSLGLNEVDDAVARLLVAARAGNDQNAAEAASSVIGFGDSAVSKLLDGISARTPSEIAWSLRCLRAIRTSRARDVAFAMCAHAYASVRAEAAILAGTIGGEAAVPLLIKASADRDATVRRRAFDGLVQTGSVAPELVAVATQGILDADTWIVVDSVMILDRIPASPDISGDRVLAAVSAAVGRLDDHNAAATLDLVVRRAGIHSGPLLMKALDAKKPAVVVEALDAAARLRLASAVPKVSRLAKSSDRRLAKAAIDCLARINDSSTIGFLVDLLEGAKDAELMDAIAVALRKMTGQLFGTDVSGWRKWLASR
jgi:HEAT repeat protein